MRTIFNSLLLCIVLCLTACSVESITEQSQQEDKNSSYEMFSVAPKGDVDFFVSESMLSKYLRLVCKGREVDLIEPIVEDGVTLAYYVKFSEDKGWNLIAADTRVTPVLSESPSGSFIREEEGPSNGILGTLKNVVDVRESTNANVQAIWKFLCPDLDKPKTKTGTKALRAMTEGMWMPVDTIFAYDTILSTRTIATKWGQDYPWNAYTPLDSANCNYPSAVGCTAVASGQILYRYLYLTNGLYNIPDSVNMSTGHPIFVTFTSDWSGMAASFQNSNPSSRNKVAKFLSWLGYNMNAAYHFDGTRIGIPEASLFMSDYLQFNTSQSYNYNTAHSNVLNNIPVLMSVFYTPNDGHAFIIDACKEIKYQAIVRYVFDPYHSVSEEEFFSHPSWMFEWPGAGSGYDPEKEDTWLTRPIDIIDNTYFLMNWGWDGLYDDATYIARSKQYFYNEDFSVLYYSTDVIAPVSWIVGGNNYYIVQYMLYGFRRLD